MAYSSKIANELLYTPFDQKASVNAEISFALTEREFCEHCYVPPMFDKNLNEFGEGEYTEHDDKIVNINHGG